MEPPPPPVDGRSYRQLLDEAVARIPVHTPEWTNRNASDPGITLLQLWAFMTESLLYRSSLIPERNRQAFLRLLGHARRPARAATGLVTFDNRRGPMSPGVVLDRDVEVAAGAVPFRTENGLAVLPVEGKAFVKRRAEIPALDRADVEREYEALYAGFAEPGTDFDYYETAQVDWHAAEREPLDLAGTVDGMLWLALLARPGDLPADVRDSLAHQTLTVGVVPDVRATARLLPAGGGDPQQSPAGLEFALPNLATPLPEQAEGRQASYVPVPTVSTADLTTTAGVVQLELPDRGRLDVWPLDPTEDGVGGFPPALEGADADRLVTWLRIRPAPSGSSPASGPGAGARLRWLGTNAALVRQRAHVPVETLGRGTGGGDQRVQLGQTPVLGDSLRLSVGGVVWERVDDLLGAGPEVALPDAAGRPTDPGDRTDVYTVDLQSGAVAFGDGVHGRRPPLGVAITATYDHGGGRRGLVAAGAITKGPALPAGVKVTNPVSTWGGDEPESVADAERSAAAFLRHRDRLVAPEDFRDVVAGTPGVDLARVEVLPLFHPSLSHPGLGEVSVAGAVTLLVVPRYDAVHQDTPDPDRHVLDAVCAHVEPRRLVTTELHVRGPDYVPVWVSVGFEALPGRDLALVREELRRSLRTFLSALAGGMPGRGWPLHTDVERLEAWVVAARVEGVAKVTDVLLSGADGVGVDRVTLTGLQLPRLVAVSARQGLPQPLTELLGTAPTQPDVPLLPIPYVPAEC
ncbi:putative baseplate assembly protein [Geodermatophilus sp. SYSU D01062]